MAFDLNQSYCTEEEVEAHARQDFTALTIPTVTQVEQFAREITREVQLATVRAGATVDFAPPKSTWSAAYPAIAVVLTAAASIGAAWRATRATPGGEDVRKLEQQLEEDYLRYIGNLNTGGDIRGLIIEMILESTTAGGAGFIASDATEGEVRVLDYTPVADVEPPFRMDDPE